MIRKAKFENFKGLRDVEITFESRFTVLVGPNGTGKTSVLQGVQLVALASSKNFAHLPLDSWRGSLDRPLRVTLTDEAGNGYSVESKPPVQLTPGEMSPVPRQVFHVLKGAVLHDDPTFRFSDPPFGPALKPAFIGSEIAAPSLTSVVPPVVEVSGRGLPSLLGYFKLREDELFAKTEDCLRSILPNVRKLRIDEVVPLSNGHGVPKSLLFDTNFRQKIAASDMSDGTLYILALIATILGPHRPKTLLIDDIDMRLHPKAQYELVTLLKKFLDEFPDLQIIATSHSPYILDRLELNEVLVTDLADDGSVIIAPLTAHPSYDKWKDTMTPGEFWSHTGEGWLKHLKREPAAP